jgi:AcrR family transcriptional regulator
MLDKRGRILDAATAVVGESGMANFTQPRVAARAGLRQSHLTYYFPTRDDLVAALAERVVTLRLEATQATLDAENPLAALVDLLLDPHHTRLLTGLIETTHRDERVGAAFDDLRERIAPLTGQLLSSLGKASTPATRLLVHTTGTGVAVLALASGADAFRARATEAMTALIDSMPADTAGGSGG